MIGITSRAQSLWGSMNSNARGIIAATSRPS